MEVVARNESIRVTPLHSAASGGHAAIVKLLLEAGADPNAAQDGGFTPLHSAAQNDDRESAEALLEPAPIRRSRATTARRPLSSPATTRATYSAEISSIRLPHGSATKQRRTPGIASSSVTSTPPASSRSRNSL